jgi:biotin carboxylase
VDCFVLDGVVHVLLMREKVKQRFADGRSVLVGSISPALLDSVQQEHITDSLHSIAAAFDLQNGPLLVQGILHEGTFKVIEVAGRLGGGTNYQNILQTTGVDAMDATLDVLLHGSTSVQVKSQQVHSASNYVFMREGELGEFRVPDQMPFTDRTFKMMIMQGAGYHAPPGLSAKNQVAKFLVQASSRQELVEQISSAYRNMDVLDGHGGSLLLRDVNLCVALDQDSDGRATQSITQLA